MVDSVLGSSTHTELIKGYAISRIFEQGQIIPDFLAFQESSLHWGALRKVVASILESSTHTELIEGYAALGDVEHIEATKERYTRTHDKSISHYV